MHVFRTAVEQGDWDAAVALLDPHVRFRSPAVHTPYEGKEVVAPDSCVWSRPCSRTSPTPTS